MIPFPGLVLFCLCWGVWLLPNAIVDVLLYDRQAIVAGEYWRLWTAHLTHFTVSQVSIDTVIIVILSYALKDHVESRFLSMSILLAMPAILLLQLWLVPNIQEYRGASSIVSMMWILMAGFYLQRGRLFARQFFFAVAFLLLFVIKVWEDSLSDFVMISQLPSGILVAWQVHAFGALTGAITWFVRGNFCKGTLGPWIH